MANRHIFIGDIHGMSEALAALIEKLAPDAGDRVVFLGDLVDKGPDAAGVVRMVRQMKDEAAFETVLIEGNHEDLHARYRVNLAVRPTVAAEQEAGNGELASLNAQLAPEDVAFLESAVPFFRLDAHDILAVHGGIPGDMLAFPTSLDEALELKGKGRRSFRKILRTRFVSADTGAFLVQGHETAGDPFWADSYDGRFGHVIFGHNPFMQGPAMFPFATGIDTGAVHGGALTALVVDGNGRRTFVSVPC